MAAAVEQRISNPVPDFDREQPQQQHQHAVDAFTSIMTELQGSQAGDLARQLMSGITKLSGSYSKPGHQFLGYLGQLLQHKVFRRLHKVAQLGYVWPTSRQPSYSRLDHSIRVMVSAARALGSIADSIPQPPQQQVPALLSVLVAALLHDVGHGPLSHTFECAAAPDLLALHRSSKISKWKHEKQGEAMIALMFKDPALTWLRQLSQEDINNMIDSKRLTEDKAHKKAVWIYQIVCNEACGLDVDFLTYIQDDAQLLLGKDELKLVAEAYGGKPHELFLPLIDGMTVVENQVCWPVHLLPLILMTLRMRCFLHFYGYQEPLAKAKELMLLKAMVLAARAGVSAFTEMLQDGNEELYLQEAWEDNVRNRIITAEEFPSSPELLLAKELVCNMEINPWPTLCEVWIAPPFTPTTDLDNEACKKWEKEAAQVLKEQLPAQLAKQHHQAVHGYNNTNTQPAPIHVYTYKVDHKAGFCRPLDTVPLYVERGGHKHRLAAGEWADHLPRLAHEVNEIQKWQGSWGWLVCRLYLTEPTTPAAASHLQTLYADEVSRLLPKLLPKPLGEEIQWAVPKQRELWLHDIINRGPACRMDLVDQCPAGPQSAAMDES